MLPSETLFCLLLSLCFVIDEWVIAMQDLSGTSNRSELILKCHTAKYIFTSEAASKNANTLAGHQLVLQVSSMLGCMV